MEALFPYLAYILGAGIGVLILVCFVDGGSSKRQTQMRQPRQIYFPPGRPHAAPPGLTADEYPGVGLLHVPGSDQAKCL